MARRPRTGAKQLGAGLQSPEEEPKGEEAHELRKPSGVVRGPAHGRCQHSAAPASIGTLEAALAETSGKIRRFLLDFAEERASELAPHATVLLLDCR